MWENKHILNILIVFLRKIITFEKFGLPDLQELKQATYPIKLA